MEFKQLTLGPIMADLSYFDMNMGKKRKKKKDLLSSWKKILSSFRQLSMLEESVL